MSKKFAASILAAFSVFSAADMARAEGADGPSYPALASVQNVQSRAAVRAAARLADGDGAASAEQSGSADGATYPAIQSAVASRRGAAEVRPEARAAVVVATIGLGDERYGA